MKWVRRTLPAGDRCECPGHGAAYGAVRGPWPPRASRNARTVFSGLARYRRPTSTHPEDRELTVKSPDLGIAQHWVWVTGPHCYANPDGSDRDDLDPAAGYVPDDGWWRCHKDTREGDQVLLYRTRPRMDIAYRIKARSDAYPVRVEPGQRGGKYGCDYEVLEKFADPMTLGEISADTALAGWGARNARFQGSVFGIPTEMWDHLIARLVADPAECARRAENARRQVNQVREIKRRLAEHPALFSAVGLNLRLPVRRHPCRNEGA